MKDMSGMWQFNPDASAVLPKVNSPTNQGKAAASAI
jgi:hypothetical protein